MSLIGTLELQPSQVRLFKPLKLLHIFSMLERFGASIRKQALS